MEKLALGERFRKMESEIPAGDITVEKVVAPEQSYQQMPSTGIVGGMYMPANYGMIFNATGTAAVPAALTPRQLDLEGIS